MKHVKILLAVGVLMLPICERVVSAKDAPKAKSGQKPQDKMGDPPAPQGNTVGRFAIQSFKHGDSEIIMRLDTFTGRVWTYLDLPLPEKDGTFKGDGVAYWSRSMEEDEGDQTLTERFRQEPGAPPAPQPSPKAP